MYSYFARSDKNSEAVSEKFLFVNNFGYNEDSLEMNVKRERGRVDYQLIYVKSGALEITEGKEKVILSSGGVCPFRPNEPQIYRISKKPTTFFWIHFSGRECESLLGFFKERVMNCLRH